MSKQFDHDKFFSYILKQHASQLGCSEEQLLHQAKQSEPLFLVHAKKRAQQRSMSTESVLREDLEALLNSKYPTPDCLTPSEVEESVVGTLELDSAENAHIAECPYCRSLLQGVLISPARVEALVQNVRSLASALAPDALSSVSSVTRDR
jgi:hypothetical protein